MSSPELRQHHLNLLRSQSSILAKQAMKDQLLNISGLATGSNPSDFLLPKDTQDVLGFLTLVRNRYGQNHWPNSSNIDLKHRYFGLKIWRDQSKYPTHPLNSALFLRGVASWSAYRIGVLDLDAHKPPVMLCNDGLLRCHRSPYVFHESFGFGYGQLPVPIKFEEIKENLAQFSVKNGPVDNEVWDYVAQRFNLSQRIGILLDSPEKPMSISLRSQANV